MQKELTDFLNFPRRGTILGVQNVTLYCKIDTVIQGLYATEPEISAPEKSVFVLGLFEFITNAHCCARSE